MFLWAWLFGTLASAFHFWWLWFLVVPVEPVTRFLLNFAVVLLFAYLGLYPAVFAVVVRRLGLWSAPLVWPLLEYVRSVGQIAFPWDLLGYTMTPHVPFIQTAAFGGVYLVSAWVVLINLLMHRIVRNVECRTSNVECFRSRLSPPLIALFLALLVPPGLAALRLRPNRPWFDIAIVQPNVSPIDKGDRASREQIYSDLLRLTREAGRFRPQLILLPETATLLDITGIHNEIHQDLHALVDSLGIEVFTGSPLQNTERGTWHNGAALLRPTERPAVQRYYKIRLVPFSEKIPYADELPVLLRLIGTADMGNWDRGRDYTVFNWTGGTLAGLICYEAIFPDLARSFTRRGAGLLAVVTNDGWFSRIVGAQQHAELAVMRTVENGVPMVRSANNGISFIVDPYGRVLAKTGLFTQTVLFGTVPAPIPATPYQRYGDWFILLCLAGAAAFAVVHVVRRWKTAQRPRRPGRPAA